MIPKMVQNKTILPKHTLMENSTHMNTTGILTGVNTPTDTSTPRRKTGLSSLACRVPSDILSQFEKWCRTAVIVPRFSFNSPPSERHSITQDL